MSRSDALLQPLKDYDAAGGVVYRKRPVEVTAMRWDGKDRQRLTAFFGADRIEFILREVRIRTLEGVMTAQPGDWIIRGVEGELYPCNPFIFAATYEPAVKLGTSVTEPK